jgi:RimJ/RimL family protein N-acetyltransferase
LPSQRLRLIPVDADLCDLLAAPEALAGTIGAELYLPFPEPDLADLLTRHARRLAADPSRPEFGPWLVVTRETQQLVGGAGFHGLPAVDGTVELGFGIAVPHRRQGFATEAARTLLGWALGQPDVKRVVARCEPDNEPSVRTLERIGLRQTGMDGTLLRWESDEDV